MSDPFTAEEERTLQEQMTDKASPSCLPSCPRCGDQLEVTPVPPRSDVSYVRHRAILQCSPCQLRCVVDMK